MSERNVLSDNKKKTLTTRQGRQGEERLIERPWLQLICCAPVSGCEVGRVFRSSGSRQDRGPVKGPLSRRSLLKLVDSPRS